MNWMKRTAMALIAGAALSFAASAPASAASAAPAAAVNTLNAGASAAQSDSLIEVGRRHRWGGHRFHGRHAWGGHRRWGGHRGWRRHGWRRHRDRGFRWWYAAPLIAAPFIYHGYGYGHGYSNSCYRECRYYHGPRYCRYNWRRYC